METWQLVAVSASAGWALAHLGNLLHLRMMAWWDRRQSQDIKS